VPTDIPITWGWTDVLNYVDTADGSYIIACRANWIGSKCSPLIPGTVFQMRYKGSQMEIAGLRGQKMIVATFNILQYLPRNNNAASAATH
jgi:hypothetical protein